MSMCLEILVYIDRLRIYYRVDFGDHIWVSSMSEDRRKIM